MPKGSGRKAKSGKNVIHQINLRMNDDLYWKIKVESTIEKMGPADWITKFLTGYFASK